MKNERQSAPRNGFSLIELLVVIGVIGILLGLLIPAVQHVRAAAHRSACASNLREIGIALHHYHKDHGRFPPYSYRDSRTVANNVLSWRALLLPYIEQGPLWTISEQACRSNPDPTRDPPHIGFRIVIKLYGCPADGRLGTPLTNASGLSAAYTSYVGVAGGWMSDGVMTLPGARLDEIHDGTSNTVMVGERPPSDDLRAGQWYPMVTTPAAAEWGGPDPSLFAVNAIGGGVPCVGSMVFRPGRTDNPCDVWHFWSLHRGGANFLFADGSVRFLPYSAQPIMVALATRSGSEIVKLPE